MRTVATLQSNELAMLVRRFTSRSAALYGSWYGTLRVVKHRVSISFRTQRHKDAEFFDELRYTPPLRSSLCLEDGCFQKLSSLYPFVFLKQIPDTPWRVLLFPIYSDDEFQLLPIYNKV